MLQTYTHTRFSLSEHGEVMNDGSFGQPAGTFEAKGHTISSTSFEFGTLNGGSIIQLVYGYGQRSQPLVNLDNSLTLSLSLPSLFGVTLVGLFGGDWDLPSMQVGGDTRGSNRPGVL